MKGNCDKAHTFRYLEIAWVRVENFHKSALLPRAHEIYLMARRTAEPSIQTDGEARVIVIEGHRSRVWALGFIDKLSRIHPGGQECKLSRSIELDVGRRKDM
jgi:hypothetical protein